MLYKVFVCLSLAYSAIKSSDRGDHQAINGRQSVQSGHYWFISGRNKVIGRRSGYCLSVIAQLSSHSMKPVDDRLIVNRRLAD